MDLEALANDAWNKGKQYLQKPIAIAALAAMPLIGCGKSESGPSTPPAVQQKTEYKTPTPAQPAPPAQNPAPSPTPPVVQEEFPDSYGFYAVSNNKLVELAKGQHAKIDDPNAQFIVFDKMLSTFGTRIAEIYQQTHSGRKVLDVKTKPVPNQNEAVRIVPREPLNPGIYRFTNGATFEIDNGKLSKILVTSQLTTQSKEEIQFTAIGGKAPLTYEVTANGLQLDKLIKGHILVVSPGVNTPDYLQGKMIRIPLYEAESKKIEVDDEYVGIGAVHLKKRFGIPAEFSIPLALEITVRDSSPTPLESKLKINYSERRNDLLLPKTTRDELRNIWYRLAGFKASYGHWIEIDGKPYSPISIAGEWKAEWEGADWQQDKPAKGTTTYKIQQENHMLKGTFKDHDGLEGTITGEIKGQWISFNKKYKEVSVEYQGIINAEYSGKDIKTGDIFGMWESKGARGQWSFEKK